MCLCDYQRRFVLVLIIVNEFLAFADINFIIANPCYTDNNRHLHVGLTHKSVGVVIIYAA